VRRDASDHVDIERAVEGVGASACGEEAVGLVSSSASLGVAASASTREGEEDDVGETGEMDRCSELDDVSTMRVGGCDNFDFRF